MSDLRNTAKELLPGDYTIEELQFTDGTSHRRGVHFTDYREFDGGYRVERWLLHEDDTDAKRQTMVVYEGGDAGE